jgi:hypothetical protein
MHVSKEVNYVFFVNLVLAQEAIMKWVLHDMNMVKIRLCLFDKNTCQTQSI